ncbi:transposase domain-containing protein [Paralcaligenes ureilyticus]|uniref:transposase domain-containing protein n=1 Tax=Paralcaligenes ureilyticus TaxID=627131 RepID=UPI0010445C1F
MTQNPRSEDGSLAVDLIICLITLLKHRYLHSVFERIAEHPINKIDELLPWNLDIQSENLRKVAKRP